MVQYLLNATAIWLISLVVYDLLLKRETHYLYNRVYLVLTFLAGLFLPLWKWSNDSVVYSSEISKRVIRQATSVKQDIDTSTHHATVIGWGHYMVYLYLVGVVVAFVLLLIEVVKVISFYKKGIKNTNGKWTVIETSREHAPFSMFRYLFVGSKKQYTKEQWDIVLCHEAQHARSFHFADQLLFQLGKIIFWFHPLVYVYGNHLLMLHEYEADHKSATDTHTYGTFLIEQALLQSAPAVSHSFNRSPIKSRIIMLTKKSSLLTRVKYLVVIPLIAACFLLFTQNVFSYNRKRIGDTIQYRGNKLTVKTLRDTVVVLNPVTGKKEMTVTRMDALIKFNGKHIYQDDHDNPDITPERNKPIIQKIMIDANSTLSKLPDASYQIYVSSTIFDENGKLSYYETPMLNRSIHRGGIYYYATPKQKEWAEKQVKKGVFTKAVYQPEIDKNLKKSIIAKVYSVLDEEPKTKAIMVAGKGVPYRNDIEINFSVKDHHVALDQ